MYEEYFQFSTSPFRLNPDPKFFFGSRSHNKAMAYLHYGLRQAEGFIVITGEIGAGKSMLIGHLIDQLDRSNVVAANLLTTNLEPSALLSHILSAFRIEPAGTGESAAIEAFEDFLFDQMNRGRRVLLIVDEAQNLPVRTIEELRMLSNMDYEGTPLFQVFLVGQPEFRTILSKSDMEQFRQRIIASYHLEPLRAEETKEYIRHRLSVVGWAGDNPSISDEAFAALYKVTGGVPRKINKLCNRIFLYCSIEKLNAIDLDVVKTVVTDLRQDSIESVETGAINEAVPSTPAKADEVVKPETAAERHKADDKVQSQPKLKAVGEPPEPKSEPRRVDKAPVVIPFDAVRKVASAEKKSDKSDEGAAAPASAKAESEEKPAPAKKPERAAKKKATKPSSKAQGAKMSEEAKPAPASEAESGQMSVLDRLRTERSSKTASEELREDAADKPEPATLTDVAKAIAEVSDAELKDGEPANVKADVPARDATSEENLDALPQIGEPALAEDPKGWRQSIVKSINETHAELKAAHSNVSRLRRKLGDIDKRRLEKRQRIAANLTRAESLLSEIRNAWR